ncbi:hypothetical protein [Salinibacter altiplanensis]|uniref:hypothetical protein n=1 Tax=Salinibacter altiplanensis TaxID=1803181 RepID=UPI00131A5946|nr:hypothetical protein [Salinibacter altiplanensis]
MRSSIAHLGIEIFGLGLPVAWGLDPTDERGAFLLHDLFLLGLCTGTSLLPQAAPTLRQGRLFAAGATLVGAAAFLHDNVLHGTVEIEFVALLYLVAVISVPFRPWQGFGIGVGIGGVLYLFAAQGWLIPAKQAQMVQANNYALAVLAATLVATLAGGILYATGLAHLLYLQSNVQWRKYVPVQALIR